MKCFVLSLLALFCSNASFSQSDIPEDWKVSPEQAGKMIEYYSSCTKCPASRATPDKAKEDSLRNLFPDAKSITWENARYTKEDVERYAKRINVPARSAASQVTGYSTQLFKIIAADGSEHYFDIVTICPPPSICDSP